MAVRLNPITSATASSSNISMFRRIRGAKSTSIGRDSWFVVRGSGLVIRGSWRGLLHAPVLTTSHRPRTTNHEPRITNHAGFYGADAETDSRASTIYRS